MPSVGRAISEQSIPATPLGPASGVAVTHCCGAWCIGWAAEAQRHRNVVDSAGQMYRPDKRKSNRARLTLDTRYCSLRHRPGPSVPRSQGPGSAIRVIATREEQQPASWSRAPLLCHGRSSADPSACLRCLELALFNGDARGSAPSLRTGFVGTTSPVSTDVGSPPGGVRAAIHGSASQVLRRGVTETVPGPGSVG